MGFIFTSRDRLSPLCFLSFALFNLLDFLQFPVGKNVLRTTHLSHSAWLFNNMLQLLFSCKRPETNSACAQRDAMVFPRVVRGHVLIISTITVILEPDSTICKICKFCKLTLQLCFRNNFLLSSSSVSFNSLLPLLLLLLGSLCQGLLEHFVRRTVENFCPTLGPENKGSNSHKGQAC